MSADRDREEEIFDAARDIVSAGERAAYLAKACGADAPLRQRIEGMLAADAAAGEFFKTHGAPSPTVSLADASLLPSIEKPGDRIGRFKLLQQIGEGGMGLVYMAEQDQPVRRSVALKIIKLGMDTRQVVARFEAERQALAMMNHPHIAKVFDAGATDSGRPYFVMELVRGIPITEYCDKNCLPTRQRLDLFILVCQAVQHAHQKGVIHRDLKPSNILVTLNDGVPWPMIIDFGIAKATHHRLTEKTLFTHFAQMIGTPAYMSPEQAEMSKLDVDTRTDIYALGVLLYELLTGTTPFPTKELLNLGCQEMQRTIAQKEPPRLSTRLSTMANEDRTVVARNRSVEVFALAKLFRGDLDWIAMKCLEKDRARRYETANGLAADIQRHLHNEPVVARPPSQLYRFQKLVRRNKLAFAAAGALAMMLLLGVIGSTWQAMRATRAEREQSRLREDAQKAQATEAALHKEAQKSLARVEAAERESQRQLHSALSEQARATVISGQLGQRVRALDALRRAAAISTSAELRREALAALSLPDLRFERELSFGADAIRMQFDPAFERIAVGRVKGPIEIRAVSDNRLLATLPASTNLPSFYRKWSADGRFLAVKRDYPDGGRHADWEIWDMSKPERVLVLRDLYRDAFAFHPRLTRFIAGSETEGAIIWDLENNRELVRFPSITRAHLLRFSPDGDRFAAISPSTPGMIVSVYDATRPDSSAVAVSPHITERINTVAWHPAGRWLAVLDSGTSVHWMDAQSGAIGLMGHHKSSAVQAVFSPEGDYLFTGGWEKELICWETRTKRRAFNISLNSYTIQFSADGRRCALLTSSSAQLHYFERPAAHRALAEDLGGLVNQATFSPDGRWLAASGDKHVGLWDLTSAGPGAVLDEASNTILFFTPDGHEMFATRNPQGTPACFRWKITPATNATAPPTLTRLPLTKPRGFTSLSVWSNFVVMTGTNGSRVIDLSEGEGASKRWTSTHAGINGVSPDGRWLGIYQSFGTDLHIYRLPGLESVAKLTHPASISDFRFSPPGNEVAIGSFRNPPGRVEFWNTATWERTRVLTNFGGLLYMPDPRALWLTKDLRTAGLYNAHTAQRLLPLPPNMLPLALSPDGRHLAVSVDARRVQVWDLAEVRQELHALGLDWDLNP